MGRVNRAIAADINEGPLKAAREQIERAGLSQKISLRLTDGLAGLENEGLTDIAICGMGGELIVSILDRAPFVKDKDIRLVLQPMTHAADLRYYLAREGFEILFERTATAAGKCYFCFSAAYTGAPYTISRVEAAFGRLPEEGVGEELLALIRKEKRAVEKKCRGLRDGGIPDKEEERYLSELTALLKEKEG